MVCTRCKMVVMGVLTQLGLHFTRVELGQAEITGDISNAQEDKIRSRLLMSGLELVKDIKSILIERIKKVIIELVHYTEEPLSINLSLYLSRELKHSYTYMANIFSEAQGHSIESFFIEHKIERVKELLNNNELNLTEIAYKMHYSSVAHLSAQFRKVTGNTASHYKHLEEVRRAMPEEI